MDVQSGQKAIADFFFKRIAQRVDELLKRHLVPVYVRKVSRYGNSPVPKLTQVGTAFRVQWHGHPFLISAAHVFYGHGFDEDPLDKEVYDGTIVKPLRNFDAIGLGGLDQGIQVGARHGAVDGVTEEPAFATEHEGANGVLAAVVVDGHFAVRQEGGQLRPLTERVVNGFPEAALGQHLGAQCLEPGVEALHERRRVRGSNLEPLFGPHRMFPIPQRALDQVELADEIQRALRVAAVTGGRLARLVELAPRVRLIRGSA